MHPVNEHSLITGAKPAVSASYIPYMTARQTRRHVSLTVGDVIDCSRVTSQQPTQNNLH